MKQKAKLRPIERVQPEVNLEKTAKVRAHRHNSTHEFKAKVMELMPAVRIQVAKERIQADSKSINLAIANGAKWNPGQVRTVLGPRGSTNMNTPTREDYKRKRGQAGKGGAPLSLEALRAKEFSDKR